MGLAYNPKKSYKEFFIEDVLKSVDYVFAEGKPLFLMGDFNINYRSKSEKELVSNALIPYSLTVTNKLTPTRYDNEKGTVIDYIIADKRDVKYTHVSEAPFCTDHNLLICVTNIKRKEIVKAKKVEFFDRKGYNVKDFNEDILRAPWHLLYQETNINKMFDVFNNIVTKILGQHAPLKKCFIRNHKPKQILNPVFNCEKGELLRNKKQKAKQEYEANSSPESFKQYKVARNKYNNFLKKSYECQQQEMYSELDTSRKRWKFINTIRNSFNQQIYIPEIRNSFGTIISDTLAITNLLNYRFSTLGVFKGPSIERLNSTEVNHGRPKFELRFFTEKEIFDVVKQLNSKKPLGPSKLPAWALKDAISALGPHITFLLNACLRANIFPDCLKKAHVIPLYKKDDPLDPGNYRPISITPALSKVFEKLISQQLTEYLSREKILNAKQFGFRPGYSTSDALLFTTENIRSELDKNNKVAAAFLDLSKAFDSISHLILIQKFKELSIGVNTIELFKSFLSQREQRVVLNGFMSDWLTLNQGVPQGTILGPLFFIIYVNDMPQIIKNSCTMIQYADDTTLFCAGQNIENCIQHLELNLKEVINYFNQNKLMINVGKTKFVIFRKHSQDKTTKDLQLQIEGTIIEQSDSTKFLGVILDQTLSYKQEVDKILKNMAIAIQTIKNIRNQLPHSVRVLLIKTLVLSHLHYTCLLLNGCSNQLLNKLEKQIKWAIRTSLSVQRNISVRVYRINHDIPTANQIIRYRSLQYYSRLFLKNLPAFKTLKFPNLPEYYNFRTKHFKMTGNAKTDFMQKSFAYLTTKRFENFVTNYQVDLKNVKIGKIKSLAKQHVMQNYGLEEST